MIFAGVDPGTSSYAVAMVDGLGRVINYTEFPTDQVEKDVLSIIGHILKYKPTLISLPSGHGLPFIKARDLEEDDIFQMTLSTTGRGPLHSFLRASKRLPGITIPSVVELLSVPRHRKVNMIDLGTADKVASAFFYRTMFRDFVLVETGSKFISALAVLDGVIVDGLGSSILPGSAGFVDGEVAYLLSQRRPLTKNLIYSTGTFQRAMEVAEMFAKYYAEEYQVPVLVSGKRKDRVPFGLKFDFRFKESAVGAAYIASAFAGFRFKEYIDMLNSTGTPIDYVELEGWEETITWIRTRS
ncbi:hypothetical protein L3N51_02153 [Metallosphaera sp. J1]|uniref:DUF1464 family protein n=1 Tax=Metallosphaera javensis (ex Hofmann et al. 2022) TaxID=99938 RepID=UPI001EDD77E0|nr:DUF1464 family protein [Metallosphaera javensis (ex Hofmann et al. 2022)]MCG3109857.1 hypothetical protein [Metallosphaera javensis (ex Hofmann et al. 2022)]